MQGTLLFCNMFMRVDYPLKLFVSELVQEDMHHCLRAWELHQRNQDEAFCCLCCYHFMVMDYGLHCGFRNASCAPRPATSRPADQPVGGTVPAEPGGSEFGRKYEVVFTLSH